jgi:hypothetical protein
MPPVAVREILEIKQESSLVPVLLRIDTLGGVKSSLIVILAVEVQPFDPVTIT